MNGRKPTLRAEAGRTRFRPEGPGAYSCAALTAVSTLGPMKTENLSCTS